MQQRIRRRIWRALPASTKELIERRVRRVWPPVGMVRFGSLRRLRPIDDTYGQQRGTPIDRYYIDRFLHRHAERPGYSHGDIRGRVLEVGEDTYTRRFGVLPDSPEAARVKPEGFVTGIDVLHADSSNPRATIVGDLSDGENLPSDTFDCVICLQTLLFIYDVHAAIRTLHRILRPGGVLLATVPGISQICRRDYDRWGDYWRFTSLSVRRLFEEVFPSENVTVEAHGNVLVAIAFLQGIALEELRQEELDLHDPNYQVNISVRAVKPG